MATKRQRRLTDNDKILAHVAWSLADAYDRGYTDNDLDTAIDAALTRGYTVDLQLGGELGDNWTRVDNWWIGDDEADLFRAAVKVAVEEMTTGFRRGIDGTTRKYLDLARARLTS